MTETATKPEGEANRLAAYGLAAALACLALLLRFALDPWLGDAQRQVTVFGAVAISAWRFGWKPGALTALIGLHLINFYIAPPRGAFALDQASIAGLVGGIVSCGLILWFAEAARSARQKTLRQAEEARAEEQRHREILDTLTSALFMFDKELRYRYANAAGLKLAGRAWSELVGKHVLEIFPDVGGTVEKYWRQALAEQKPATYEKHYAAFQTWFEVTILPRPDTLVILVTDIGSRKQIQEALRASEERFRSLMEQAPLSIQLLDPAGKTRRVNRAWEKLWGLKLEQLHDYKMLEDPQLETKGVAPYLRRAFAGESVELPEIAYDPNETIPDRTRHKNPVRWVSALAYPVKDSGGTVIEVVLIHLDVTNRKLAEIALKESESHFRTLAESMPQLVWTARGDGAVEYYNSQVAAYAGAKRNPDGTWAWVSLVHPDDSEATEREWASAVAGEAPYSITHRLRMATGIYRWHLSRATPVLDMQGRVSRWFGTATDIEEQKQTQETLEAIVQERTARLRETVHDMESFSYSIAHDMRAPLRSMSGYASLLFEDEKSKLSDDGAMYLSRIRAAAQRLDRLITDILSYSMLAQGRLPLEPVDAERLTREIIDTYAALQEPNATVVVEGKLPLTFGNPAALSQAISNLLVNAVKFVRPGTKPRVVISAEPVVSNRARIWFSDNGIGIAAQSQTRIFQIFQRLNPASQYDGTGIGLSIVRKAMERMNGNVGVESDGANGSRFWIELPVARASPPDPLT